MFYRLKTDFRLAIVTMMGLCAVIGITPFAIFRFIQGQLIVGIADAAILLSIVAGVVYAWVSGRTEPCCLYLGFICPSGAVLVGALAGESGLLWLYPCLVTSFFLISTRLAVLSNVLATSALLFQSEAFHDALQMWSFVATACVVSACAYVFAKQNELQRKRLERLATLDPLTGIGNRRAMDQELERALARYDRAGELATIVMFDIDHFKAINDAYGHRVGDEVLVDLTALVQQNTRIGDSLFRYGGEEFVLLLPGTSDADVKIAVNHLQLLLRKHLRHPGGTVTASFGVSQLQNGDTVCDWLARADDALYAAKVQGRDCAVYAQSPEHARASIQPHLC